MAISFLNNISFSAGAEARSLRLENLSADPATGNEGQLYFNTGTDLVRVYAGGAWTDLEGANDFLTGLSFNTADGILTATVQNQSNVTVDLDGRYALSSDIPATIVESVTGGTYITNSGTATDVVLDHDSTSRTDTTSSDNPGSGGTFQAVTSVTTNATGHVTAIDVSTVTMVTDTTYDLDVESDGANGSIIRLTGSNGLTEDVVITGDTSTVKITENTSTNFITIDLQDDVTIEGELTVSGTGQSSFGGQVTIPTTPVASTDAASKAYVDSVVEGGLIYQGGYDASTNTPDLTTSPNSILKGWTYTVTADGTFFGEQLRVGDVLIAEQDDPSALADWTTVQNNVDLADLTTVGIGNVNAGTGIGVSYSSGTATVSNTGVIGTFGVSPISTSGTNPANISIADATPGTGGGLGAIWLETGNAISITYDGGTRRTEIAAEFGTTTDAGVLRILEGTGIDVSYGANGNVTISTDGLPNGARVDLDGGSANITRTESGGQTTFAINVNAILGTTDAKNVKVEVISDSGQTVHADVTRTGTGGSSVVNVIFLGSVANSSYEALLVDVA